MRDAILRIISILKELGHTALRSLYHCNAKALKLISDSSISSPVSIALSVIVMIESRKSSTSSNYFFTTLYLILAYILLTYA